MLPIDWPRVIGLGPQIYWIKMNKCVYNNLCRSFGLGLPAKKGLNLLVGYRNHSTLKCAFNLWLLNLLLGLNPIRSSVSIQLGGLYFITKITKELASL